MSLRLRALLGSIAHGIRATAGSLLSLVGLGSLAAFVVPALIALLAYGAVTSALSTAAILDARPEVTRATLAEVAAFDGERGESIWFQFEGILETDSFETAADLGSSFRLARDPADPDRGIIVRSSIGDSSFRQRVVGATLTEDPETVRRALDAFAAPPTGFDVDPSRYLEETESGGAREQAFLPSELADEPAGTSVLVTGQVVEPAELSACAVEGGCDGDDAAWFYVLADPEGREGIVLRSPHPPNALPVELQGLFLRESFDLAPVLESEWYASIDAEVPTDRALRAGSRPPITVEASWVPAIVLGSLALLLLASLLAGYPVFGRAGTAEPRRTLAAGELIEADITGRLARGARAITLDRSPGAVHRLTIPDLALLLWRYGLLPQDQSRREAEERFVAEASEPDRLVVHERDQSALVVVEGDAASVQVEPGRLHRVAGSVPAVRFRQGVSAAYLSTRTTEERDRLAAEIAAEIARP